VKSKRKKFKNIGSILDLELDRKPQLDAFNYIRQHPQSRLEELAGAITQPDLDSLKREQAQDALVRWEAQIVNCHLDQLTTHQRQILDMIIIDGLRPAYIAKKLKISKTAVYHSVYGIYKPKSNSIQGGSLKKLRNSLLADPDYQTLQTVRALLYHSTKWTDYVIAQENRRWSPLLRQALVKAMTSCTDDQY